MLTLRVRRPKDVFASFSYNEWENHGSIFAVPVPVELTLTHTLVVSWWY